MVQAASELLGAIETKTKPVQGPPFPRGKGEAVYIFRRDGGGDGGEWVLRRVGREGIWVFDGGWSGIGILEGRNGKDGKDGGSEMG